MFLSRSVVALALLLGLAHGSAVPECEKKRGVLPFPSSLRRQRHPLRLANFSPQNNPRSDLPGLVDVGRGHVLQRSHGIRQLRF